MDVTLTIPDDLATRLRTVEDRLPEILELGFAFKKGTSFPCPTK